MAKRKTAVPFQGTAEQEAKLRQIIAAHKDQKGALMPVLQQAQELYGYLPVEVQTIIAEGLGLSLSQVYAQYILNPKGKYALAVCLGTACYVKGSGKVLERFEEKLGIKAGGITPDGKYSLDATRCIGACGLAPVMTVNGKVYGKLVPEDVDRILAEYKD